MKSSSENASESFKEKGNKIKLKEERAQLKAKRAEEKKRTKIKRDYNTNKLKM